MKSGVGISHPSRLFHEAQGCRLIVELTGYPILLCVARQKRLASFLQKGHVRVLQSNDLSFSVQIELVSFFTFYKM